MNEKLENVQRVKDFTIRLQLLYDALSWLKKNNPLYATVNIVDRDENEYDIGNIFVTDKNSVSNSIINTNEICDSFKCFKIVRENISILLADFHQGVSMFGFNAGKQCTAMCVVFISYANNFSDFSKWNTNLLNEILMKGNKHYSICRAKQQGCVSDSHLTVDEAIGNVAINNFLIETNYYYDQTLLLHGRGKIGLKQLINNFLNSSINCAIIITNG